MPHDHQGEEFNSRLWISIDLFLACVVVVFYFTGLFSEFDSILLFVEVGVLLIIISTLYLLRTFHPVLDYLYWFFKKAKMRIAIVVTLVLVIVNDIQVSTENAERARRYHSIIVPLERMLNQ